VGIGYCLEIMALNNTSISELVSSLPAYYMIKDTIAIEQGIDTGAIAHEIASQNHNEIINTLDGIRIDFIHHNCFKGGWVHLRASNTEPIFRIIAEGKTKEQCMAMIDAFKTMKIAL
jgi:phosphomannomutase